MKPISGAKEEGVEGFFKGFGKGVVGLVTRPTAGVVDFASGSFGAVRRYEHIFVFFFLYFTIFNICKNSLKNKNIF